MGGLAMSFSKKRTQAYIVPISPDELTHSDRAWLDKALEKGYDGLDKGYILDKAVNGFCQIWRLGDSEGIIITEIIQRDGGLQLWIPHIAGRGIIKKLDYFDSFFAEYGQRHNCTKAIAATDSRGLQKVYSKRWKETAKIYERRL